ncbi:MAG: hypothetical protein JSS02_10140 [Planctomycetes bacterium]|nr:hypothetical protein [Planctomycetota bacterium]
MAAAKKKKDPKPNSGLGSARARLFAGLRPLYRPVTLATAAVVVLAGILLPHFVGRVPDLSGRPEYQLSSADIEISQPPHWVPRDLLNRVIENADLPEKLRLLDDSLAQEIASAFESNPWVEEVVSVRKAYPARIAVDLKYREPVAMVEVHKGQQPIDRQGVLLPAQDFSVSESRTYPVITGVASTPQGPAGSTWGDKVVEDAAQLAVALGPVWKKLGLVAIACPASTADRAKIDEGVFVLVSKGGSRILWGHAPGSDHPGELETRQKLGRLEDYVKRFGSFDHPQGPYRIDIRHWRDISRTPLSAHGGTTEIFRL